MSKPNYKLLCWGDYSIPVPLWAKWLAFDAGDKGGLSAAWIFARKPKRVPGDKWDANDHISNREFISFVVLTPPEPGPWNEQIYWIGD